MSLNQNENNDNNLEQEEEENDSQSSLLIFNIDVGNGKEEELKIYSLDNPEKDIYDFCSLYKIDFETMQVITNQINEFIKNKQNENNTSNTNIKNDDMEKNINSDSLDKNKTKIGMRNNNSSRKLNNNSNTKESKHNNLGLFQYEIKDEKKSRRNNDNNYIKTSLSSNNMKKKNISKNKNRNQNIKPLTGNIYLENLMKNQESEKVKTTNNFDINKFIENEILKNSENNKLNSITNNNEDLNIIHKNKDLKNKNVNTERFINRGFYDKNFKYNDIKEKKLESLRNNIQDDEKDIYTFHPAINKISEKFNKIRKEKGNEFNNPNIINNYKQYQEKKIEDCKNKQIRNKLMENYSFIPSINEIDNNIYNKRKKNKIEYDNPEKIINFNQYHEELIKKCKEKHMKYNIMQEFSFQPKINHNNIRESFNNRLKFYENQSKEKLNKIKEQVEELNMNLKKPVLYKNKKYIKKKEKEKDNKNVNTDINNNQTNNINTTDNNIQKIKNTNKNNQTRNINKTNNNLQKNKNTNNNSLKKNNKNKISKNNSKINIIDNSSENSNKKNNIYKNESIYNKIKEERMKNKELERKLNEYYKNENKINKSSNNLLMNKKGKSFKKLFILLDGDEDGIISSSAINIEKIPKGVQEILKNLFRQIKEENESLDESEFLYICEEYFKMLPYEKQNIFVNFENENNSNYNENYTFMPQINEKSRKIDKKIE